MLHAIQHFDAQHASGTHPDDGKRKQTTRWQRADAVMIVTIVADDGDDDNDSSDVSLYCRRAVRRRGRCVVDTA